MPEGLDGPRLRPIFVGGCGRSGTTLLAAMLTQRGAAVAPPEAQFLVEGIAATRTEAGDDPLAFAAFVRKSWRYRLWGLPAELPETLAAGCSRPAEVMAGLARAYAHSTGAGEADLWIDHTPENVGFAPTLLTEFEGSRMIHIVRDPHAVVASVLPLDWGPASARVGARWWLSMIGMGLAAEAAFPERVRRVRYEDLVRDPQETIASVSAWLGIELESEPSSSGGLRLPTYTHRQHELVGRPPDPSRIDAWRSQLSESEIAMIDAEVKEVPEMLGYASAVPAPTIGRQGSAGEYLSVALRTVGQRWRFRKRVRRALADVSRGEG